MARIRLVVPCFNEAHRLDERAFSEFHLPGHDLRIVFVDDGSTDATADVLDRLCAKRSPQLEWVHLDSNRGKGEAVRCGMRHALRDPDTQYVGYWDADLSTPLSAVAAFLEAFEAHPKVQLVLGARVRMLGRVIERKAYRHAYGRLFATAVAALLDLPVHDTQCGAKLFRVTEDVVAAFEEPFVTRWVFDVELVARLMGRWEARGLDSAERLWELPLPEWHDVAGSKVSVFDAAFAVRDLARIGRVYRRQLAQRRRK